MSRKEAFELADRSLDPVGIIAVFVLMMLNKFVGLDLSADEVLWGSMAAGAARMLWEQRKRRNGARKPPEDA